MANKFSLIFLCHSGKTIKQIHCSKTKVAVLIALLVAVIGVLGGFSWDYITLQHNLSNTSILQRRLDLQTEEVIHQREQIQKFAHEINELKEQLVHLDQFEERIRVLANVDDKDGGGLFGVGGSAPDDLNADVDLTHRHHRLMKDMHQQINLLKRASVDQQDSFESLLKKIQTQKNIMAHTPAIRPAAGWISSRFGYRVSPFTGKREFHKGWDIANRIGTEIMATADGVVSFAGLEGTFGRLVIIDHGHGITTRYAHLNKILCKRGDRVARGKAVALMGNTGRSSGPHLHYEVRLNGVPVNPAKYILN